MFILCILYLTPINIDIFYQLRFNNFGWGKLYNRMPEYLFTKTSLLNEEMYHF